MRSRRAFGALVLAVLCLLAGACTPSQGETPSPAPTTLPPVSPSPTENAIERQQRLDYEAAEKSVRTFRAEYARLLSNGGSADASAVMKATAGSSYLKEFTDVLQAYRQLGYHQTGTEKIAYLRPDGHFDTSVQLSLCTDGTKIKTIDKGGKVVGTDDVRRAKIRVKKFGTTWRIVSGDGEAVKEC